LLPLIYTNPVAAGLFLATCLVWLVPEAAGMQRTKRFIPWVFQQQVRRTRRGVEAHALVR
jgi:hypothetical protein